MNTSYPFAAVNVYSFDSEPYPVTEPVPVYRGVTVSVLHWVHTNYDFKYVCINVQWCNEGVQMFPDTLQSSSLLPRDFFLDFYIWSDFRLSGRPSLF